MKTGRDSSLDSHQCSVPLLHFAAGFLILVYSGRGVVHSVAHVGLVDAVELVLLKKYLKRSCLQRVALAQSLDLKKCFVRAVVLVPKVSCKHATNFKSHNYSLLSN